MQTNIKIIKIFIISIISLLLVLMCINAIILFGNTLNIREMNKNILDVMNKYRNSSYDYFEALAMMSKNSVVSKMEYNLYFIYNISSCILTAVSLIFLYEYIVKKKKVLLYCFIIFIISGILCLMASRLGYRNFLSINIGFVLNDIYIPTFNLIGGAGDYIIIFSLIRTVIQMLLFSYLIFILTRFILYISMKINFKLNKIGIVLFAIIIVGLLEELIIDFMIFDLTTYILLLIGKLIEIVIASTLFIYLFILSKWNLQEKQHNNSYLTSRIIVSLLFTLVYIFIRMLLFFSSDYQYGLLYYLVIIPLIVIVEVSIFFIYFKYVERRLFTNKLLTVILCFIFIIVSILHMIIVWYIFMTLFIEGPVFSYQGLSYGLDVALLSGSMILGTISIISSVKTILKLRAQSNVTL